MRIMLRLYFILTLQLICLLTCGTHGSHSTSPDDESTLETELETLRLKQELVTTASKILHKDMVLMQKTLESNGQNHNIQYKNLSNELSSLSDFIRKDEPMQSLLDDIIRRQENQEIQIETLTNMMYTNYNDTRAILSEVLQNVQNQAVTIPDNRVIINTPKQTARQYRYTLLSRYGYGKALSPFTFEVRASSDAHIGLMENDDDLTGGIYEIVIGGWSNTKSQLRTRKQGSVRDSHNETVLSSFFYRTFRIKWNESGHIVVQKQAGGEFVTILSWTDPNPFHVGYIGVTGGLWADVSWKITI